MTTPETLPLPLREAGPYSLHDADNHAVCTFSGPHKAAHRAFVLRAVNAHADAIDALNEAIEFIANRADASDQAAMTLLSRLATTCVDAEGTGER